MNNQNTNLSNQGMSTRERGKRFLEDLKIKGPNLSNVGQVYMRPLHNQSKETQSPKEQVSKSIQGKNL
jgi:hypothetical protein